MLFLKSWPREVGLVRCEVRRRAGDGDETRPRAPSCRSPEAGAGISPLLFPPLVQEQDRLFSSLPSGRSRSRSLEA